MRSIESVYCKSKEKSSESSVGIFCRISGDGGLRSALLEISSDDIKMLSGSICSRHCHTQKEKSSKRFRVLNDKPKHLSTIPGAFPLCYTVSIGSTVYAMDIINRVIHFRSMNLGVDPNLSEQVKWRKLPSPPIRAIEFEPKLVSLAGTLFFLGADPIALVFDPVINSWSEMREPDEQYGAKWRPGSIVFSASLGESSGKLMFIERDSTQPLNSLFLYDVHSKTWEMFILPWNSGITHIDSLVIGNAVANKQEKSAVYWLHRDGFIYTFDWKTMELARGTVIGMKHECLLSMLKSCSSNISFFHLKGAIFGLFWGKINSGHATTTTTTDCHLTFLRMIKGGSKSLRAYVVGCFKNTIDGAYQCNEASLVQG